MSTKPSRVRPHVWRSRQRFANIDPPPVGILLTNGKHTCVSRPASQYIAMSRSPIACTVSQTRVGTYSPILLSYLIPARCFYTRHSGWWVICRCCRVHNKMQTGCSRGMKRSARFPLTYPRHVHGAKAAYQIPHSAPNYSVDEHADHPSASPSDCGRSYSSSQYRSTTSPAEPILSFCSMFYSLCFYRVAGAPSPSPNRLRLAVILHTQQHITCARDA